MHQSDRRDRKGKTNPALTQGLSVQHGTCTLAFITMEGNHGDVVMQTLLQIAAKAHGGADPKDRAWPPKVPSVPSSWESTGETTSWRPCMDEPLKPSSIPAGSGASGSSKKSLSVRRWTWCAEKRTADWQYLRFALNLAQQAPYLPQRITSSYAPFLALSDLREWESRKYRWNLLSLLSTFSYADSLLTPDRFFALRLVGHGN